MEAGNLSLNASSQDRQYLRKIANDISVIEKLKAFAISTKHLNTKKNTTDYYLLKLDIESSKIEFLEFKKNQLEEANNLYTQLEKKYGDNSKKDVVLIAALLLKD